MSVNPPLALLPEHTPVEDPDHQLALFDKLPSYADEHWVGMPQYANENLKPRFHIIVSFATRAAREEFAALVKQKITDTTRSIWYPAMPRMKLAGTQYVSAANGDAK